MMNIVHTTMRLAALVTLLSAATAAPALLWKRGSEETVYNSEPVDASELMGGLEGLSVVFVVGRSAGGSESLTALAPQLSSVSMIEPAAVHSHVNGVFGQGKKGESLLVQIPEVAAKLNQTMSSEFVVSANGKINKRSRQLNAATKLIVDVAPDISAEELDAAVSNAIVHADSVLLSAARSVQEVKHERMMHAHRRLEIMEKAGSKISAKRGRSRRLEEEGDAENDNQQDLTGIYYVSLTPNIFAGILFFLMFSTVAWIGIGCMGAIQGQDCYVKKMPSNGREA